MVSPSTILQTSMFVMSAHTPHFGDGQSRNTSSNFQKPKIKLKNTPLNFQKIKNIYKEGSNKKVL